MRFVRSNKELVEKNLSKRQDAKVLEDFHSLIELDELHRKTISEVDSLRAEKNKLVAGIAEERRKGGDAKELLSRSIQVAKEINEKEAKLLELEKSVRSLLMRIPNLLDEEVPFGKGEENNRILREVGEKPVFSFSPKSHIDLLSIVDGGDLERAAKTSGARFYFLKNEVALLDQAVIQFALRFLWKKGFCPVIPPYLINRVSYEGVTDLSDFENVLYKVDKEDLYLIATSEHPLCAMHSNEIFESDALPLKYAGISPCFRKEAGAHGRDTKGIFRVHQFHKIEQFVYCKPEDSKNFFQELIGNAEELLKLLGIPYRAVDICTGEIGIVASRKIDLEAWYPSQNAFREVVSCSNCGSYQAVRSGIRYRLKKGGEEKAFVHTLNSTALASPRIIVAIMENFQQEDGSIKVPKVLQEYCGFSEIFPKN